MPRVPRDNIDDLQARLAHLRKVTERKKKEQQKLRDQHRRQNELQRRLEPKILVLLCLTSGDTSAASIYLQQFNQDNKSMNTVIQNNALTEYQGMTDEERKAMLEIGGLAGRRLIKQMRKFCEELHLFSWVEKQSLSKGVAPRTTIVHDHLKTTHSIDFGCGTFSAKKRSQQQWLRRWRRRWQVNMGRITARETLPEDECQRKAFPFRTTQHQF